MEGQQMKIVWHIARILLGLIFTVFGLNGFLHFLPMPPQGGLAGQFSAALAASHFFTVVFLVQLVGGILLLSGRFIALALNILGPIIVSIVLFHIFMAPSGLPTAIVVTVLWIVVASRTRGYLAAIFNPRPDVPPDNQVRVSV
jgi:putative oxidoreductase